MNYKQWIFIGLILLLFWIIMSARSQANKINASNKKKK